MYAVIWYIKTNCILGFRGEQGLGGRGVERKGKEGEGKRIRIRILIKGAKGEGRGREVGLGCKQRLKTKSSGGYIGVTIISKRC